MRESEACQQCGARIEAESPRGLCPRCLLKLGFEGTPTSGPPKPFPVPLPATHDRIGPYRILETLGEGGMGIVYLAEQSEPIRRRVALKVMKPGMDSRQVLARFEVERQALAVMSHPNVARVFDAGATEQGRPYFVMEYVPGIPITEYCDLRCLPVKERLELFVGVCEAIQHAHQKGIIHRDMKPSNVLVSSEDGKPTLKVIDFGVAKATGQPLTERTLFTEQGVLLGTPEYMSPEQAGKTALEVDARTDIYSLGVLLYELLVGALPFDAATLRRAAAVEMMRIIREEDPPKPTTKFGSLGDTAPEVARHRHTDVRSLARQIRGELEWITMRALEKDPARRYPSASELAADVRRHLLDEPVAAGPPSRYYQLKKFARKHRTPAIALGAVLAALLVGVVASSTLYLRSEAARARAEMGAERNRLEAAATQAALSEDAERYRSLSEQAMALHRRALPPDSPALAPYLATRIYIWEVVFPHVGNSGVSPSVDEVTRLIERGLDDGDASAVSSLLLISSSDRIDEEVMTRLYRKAFALVRPRAEVGDGDASDQRELLADLLEKGVPESPPEENPEAVEQADREILALERRTHASGGSRLSRSVERLSFFLDRKADRMLRSGDLSGAEAPYREALALAQEIEPGSEVRVAEIESDLGRCLFMLGRFGEAEELLTGSYRLFQTKLTEQSATTQVALSRLVDLYAAQGKNEQAARYRSLTPEISVAEVRDLGTVRFSPGVRYQSGGLSASLGARSAWVFWSTSMSGHWEQGDDWRDSSWGLAQPLTGDGPPTIAGQTDPGGALVELIPRTAEEAAADTARQGKRCTEDCGLRWSFSPGPVIPDTGRHRTLVFYTKSLRRSAWNDRRMGASLALWPSLDAPLVRPVVRPGAGDPTLLFDPDEPPWGSGALVVGGMLHAYSCDNRKPACVLARVPLERALDRDEWRFYEGDGRWSADWRGAVPVLASTAPLSVHWNEYLEKYLAVSARWLDHRIILRTADRPEGPWSEIAQVEGFAPPTGFPWIGPAVAHAELAREGGRVETLTYVRNIDIFRSEMRAVEVEFRQASRSPGSSNTGRGR